MLSSASIQNNHVKGSRGVALLMVLSLITLLTVSIFEFSMNANTNLRLAANTRDRLQAKFMAQSALNIETFFLRHLNQLGPMKNFLPIPVTEIACSFLDSELLNQFFRYKTDDNISADVSSDSKKEDAENKNEDEGKNQTTEGMSLGIFQNVSFRCITVENEQNKINVNRLASGQRDNIQLALMGLFTGEQYDFLFEGGNSSDLHEARIQLISALTDWVDSDEEINTVAKITGQKGSGGDESSRFSGYDTNGKSKNALMDSVEEIRRVPLVNDAWFQEFMHRLTIYSSGKININEVDDSTFAGLVSSLVEIGGPSDYQKLKDVLEQKHILGEATEGLSLLKLNEATLKTLITNAGLKIDEQMWNFMVKSNQAVIGFEEEVGAFRIITLGTVGNVTNTLNVVWRGYGENVSGDFLYWKES